MRIVGGIVQHLNLQQFGWIIHLGHFVYQPLHYVTFVIKRKLDGYARQRRPWDRRQLGKSLTMLEITPHHLVAMASVTGQNHQDHEVRNQQRPVEQIEMMDSRESIVEESANELLGG